MNVSYQWIRELVDCDIPPERMAELLTAAGCAVEELTPVDDDVMLDAEVTTNRPDWLCHLGIAHEVAALTGSPLRPPAWELREEGPDVAERARVDVTPEAAAYCPRYTARCIRGVTVGESPEWLKKKLVAIGQRPINNIVDATNYVMFEMNQPLHAFDHDLLAGGRIQVRMARPGEPFQAITGESGTLAESMLVIADAEKAVALAGVKGGTNSEVHAGTTNILLEAAWFEPRQVRRTSRATRMASESSYRFERGIDPGGVARASARAAALIAGLAGGTVDAGVIDTGPDLGAPWEVAMSFSRCDRLLGFAVDPEEIAGIFARLGLEILEQDGERIRLRIPSFRQDLTREADLVEEVARLVGYDKVPTKVTMPIESSHVPPFLAAARTIRRTLAGLGYHECITDSFVPERWIGAFPHGTEGGEPVRILNPVNAERPCLRTSLAPSLLDVRRVNRHAEDVRLFEIGRAYLPGGTERLHLALLDTRGTEWARGAYEAIVRALRAEVRPAVRPEESLPGFQDHSAGRLRLGEETNAALGLADDANRRLHDLADRPALLEADLSALQALPRARNAYAPLPRHPAIRRDVALVLPEAVRWGEIESRVRETPERLESVELESVFRGKGIPQGRKSVAFRLVYRAPDRSLTDEEANALRDTVVAHLTATLPDAALRG
jgi:phenylalanyl-tRNA synthetase beta chain